MLAYLGWLVLGGFLGVTLMSLAAANRMSELRDENHELKRRIAECTCREGA